MSWPRCRCASKISAPAGSERASSSSYRARSSSAPLIASVTSRSVGTGLPSARGRHDPAQPPSDSIAAMRHVVMYADSVRSPELRHEVPVGVPDPFLYIEADGARHVIVSSMETPRLGGLGLEL